MKETFLSVVYTSLWTVILFLSLPFSATAFDIRTQSINQESRRIEITQVNANYIELTNFGESFDDVSDLWLHNGISRERIGDHQISCGGFTLITGSKLVIETAFAIDLNRGELALYYSDRFRSSELADYLNWGLSNFSSQHLEAAISKGIWNRGESLNPMIDGQSLQRQSDSGSSNEWVSTEPTFCINHEVDCNQLSGGILNGPEHELCVGRGVDRRIPAEEWTIKEYSGPNTHWVVTDENQIVKILSPDIFKVNFDGEESGTLLIYHISYLEHLDAINVGQKLDNSTECFRLSNPVRIFLSEVSPQSEISDPIYYCVDDGQRDNIDLDELHLEIPADEEIMWYVTNHHNVVIASPEDLELLNFEGTGEGLLFIWGIVGDLSTMQPVPPADVLSSGSCEDMIGPIIIYRLLNDACSSTCNEEAGDLALLNGELATTICTTDMLPDYLEALIENNKGQSRLVLTDTEGNILAIDKDDVINFEGTGIGEARVYNLAFNPKLLKLDIGINIFEIGVCNSISNPITIYRETCKVDCRPPENFRVHKSPRSDIKLSWKPSVHALKYHISFGPLSNPDISVVMSTTDSEVFVSEMNGGTFISKVKVECGEDLFSPYTDSIEFDPKGN